MRMKIPKKAETEICRKLAENLQISSDEISDILEKYGVREDDRALQRSYRKRVGQQLMASFRDDAGQREILAAPNGKGGMVYIIIDCCNDAQKLQHIQWKLQSQAAGLDSTVEKVKSRKKLLRKFQFAEIYF